MKRVIITVLLLLAACQGQQEDTYFTGTEGVDASFSPDAPPDEVFVGGDPAIFTVDVRVQNKGASVTKGGVYLSGYDPTILDIQEIEEERGSFKDCRMNIGGILYGQFDGVVQCRDLNAAGGADVGISWDFDLSKIGDESIGDILSDLWQDLSFNIGFGQNDLTIRKSGDGLSVTFDNPGFTADRAARGPYFLSLWSPWSFELNQGKEYILKGDTPANPGVNERYITYNAEATLPDDVEEVTQPIQATNCYLYTTHASTSVCIDSAPYSDEEKACTASPYKSQNGQGGPLAITQVTQEQSAGKIVFDITVEHQGDGRVYNPLRINKCSPYHPEPATEGDLNTVVLGMVYVGDQMLECTPDKHTMELYNGKGKVQCAMETERVSGSGYSTPLMVELWYGYSETVRTDVTIRRI